MKVSTGCLSDVLSSQKRTFLILNDSLFPHCQCSIQMTLHNTHICYIHIYIYIFFVLFSLAVFFKRPSCSQPKRTALRFDFDCSFDLSLEDLSTSLKTFLKIKNPTRKSLKTGTHPPWFLPSPMSTSVNHLWIWIFEDPMVNREIHTNSREPAFTFAKTATTFIERQEIVQGVGFVTIWILGSLQVVIAVVPPCLAFQ